MVYARSSRRKLSFVKQKTGIPFSPGYVYTYRLSLR